MPKSYVPEAGDIVWLEFDPQAGREQAGHRPALVLSPAIYNEKVSLAVCCPLSTKTKGYPFEVEVEIGKTTSVVLSVPSCLVRIHTTVSCPRNMPCSYY